MLVMGTLGDVGIYLCAFIGNCLVVAPKPPGRSTPLC
jgi:hypothetical protein